MTDHTDATSSGDLVEDSSDVHGYTATFKGFGIREGGDTLDPNSTGGWHEGAGVLYNAFELGNAIGKGDWSEGLSHGAVTALGTAGAMADPVGTLITGAISWVMDHIEPLPTFLDWLAGDPDKVATFATTWSNVSDHVDGIARNFNDYVEADLGDMKAAALVAYRGVARGHSYAISAMGLLCKGASEAVRIASLIIDTVRCIVRDLIAECLSQIIQIAAKCAGPQIVIFGADAIRQIIALVAKYVPKCRGWIDKLTRAVTALSKLLGKLVDEQTIVNTLFSNTLPNLVSVVPT